MSSETRREALTQLNTMEAEMKKATERMKEMEEEKEQARQKERNRQSISTPGSEVKTPRRTPARFGLWTFKKNLINHKNKVRTNHIVT